MGDDTPNDGFGDLDEYSNENEGILANEAPSSPYHETLSRRKQTLGVSMASSKKSVIEIIFPRSQFTISNAMNALRALGDEIPKK
ncbi:hypothetical protein Gotur_001460 [Gossypium turneri]